MLGGGEGVSYLCMKIVKSHMKKNMEDEMETGFRGCKIPNKTHVSLHSLERKRMEAAPITMMKLSFCQTLIVLLHYSYILLS